MKINLVYADRLIYLCVNKTAKAMPYDTPNKYPFTYTHSNQTATGLVESEMYFEGFATYVEDEETEMNAWGVEAILTGFAQFQNGKLVAKVTGLNTDNWTVPDYEAFEKACIDAATHQFKVKHTINDGRFFEAKAAVV